MNPATLIAIGVVYFVLLWLVSLLSSRKADNTQFFLAGRSSRWYVVAFGMIGATISGVSFVSVPGWVNKSQFSYMQMTLGFFVGYVIIAYVLLPLYYRLGLISIYSYLDRRFGIYTYKTGAAFFILSRLLGSSIRFYLAILVLEEFVLREIGISFYLASFISLLLIWFYTHRSGIATVVWTDSLQTAFMLLALIMTFLTIGQIMNWDIVQSISQISSSDYSRVFFLDWQDKRNFFKQFISGVLVCITMTGLDQDMMQKNLTCRNIGEAQTNMISYGVAVSFVNLLFLSLGALLYLFATSKGITESGDRLFPFLAKSHLGAVVAVSFFIGIIAAAYSSADSSLTSLTTSFCIDILGIERKGATNAHQNQTRKAVHLIISAVYLLFMYGFKYFAYQDLIDMVFKIAGYTYGPLLGLFVFGLLSRHAVFDKYVPVVCFFAPVLTYGLVEFLQSGGYYQFAYEYLAINALLTMFGLWLIRKTS